MVYLLNHFSPSIESCCKGLDDPLNIIYLKWKQYKMSAVIQIHGALWVHGTMCCFGTHIFFVAFDWTKIHSEQHGGNAFVNECLLSRKKKKKTQRDREIRHLPYNDFMGIY